MNTRIEERLVIKKSIRNKIYKFLFTIIVFLLGMISTKVNETLKPTLNKLLFEDSINFIKTRNIYNKYFNNKLEENKPVQAEKISYIKEEKTETGVKLTVNDDYVVPCIEDGIIVYIGTKNNLNTIIIEQVDGIKTTYSNIDITNYKLYDFIEKGEIIGNVINNEIYLSQEKEGVYIDYKKYI